MRGIEPNTADKSNLFTAYFPKFASDPLRAGGGPLFAPCCRSVVNRLGFYGLVVLLNSPYTAVAAQIIHCCRRVKALG